jgi:uncharacterized membrane protein
MFHKSRPFVLALSFLGIFILISLFATTHVFASEPKDQKIAKVISVSESKQNGFNEQMVEMQIYNDQADDETIFIVNNVPDNQAYAITAKPGREYLVNFDESVGQIYISDYYREKTVLGLLSLFCILVIIFGAFRGFKALISLLLTGLAIVYIFLPGIQAGYNPVLLAILISSFATASTMILIAGFTKKSLAATLGTTGGVTAAGILAFFVIEMAPLSGLASTESHILLANSEGLNLNFQGMLAAGILISSLGASMDVSISIASSTQEIFEANLKQSRKELFAHAMNVGRDIMGTMTNTLILAYTGASIPLFMLLSQDSGIRVLNIEIIATQVSSALIGSIGLLLAIPITAIVSVFLLKPYNSQGCD